MVMGNSMVCKVGCAMNGAIHMKKQSISTFAFLKSDTSWLQVNLSPGWKAVPPNKLVPI